MSYWPTPADVADDLVSWVLEPWHHTGDGVRVLEPSAGTGGLIDAIRHHLPDAHITALEPDPDRAATLRTRTDIGHLEPTTLEAYLTGVGPGHEPFHLVIMNPPFTLPGQPEAWADHILAIYHHPHLLAPGAIVAAVAPYVVLTGRSKRVRAVRELADGFGAAEPATRGAFSATGAKVSAALLWIQKATP
jgi:tRNA1(Val) A37 N6-methylase TrmN6